MIVICQGNASTFSSDCPWNWKYREPTPFRRKRPMRLLTVAERTQNYHKINGRYCRSRGKGYVGTLERGWRGVVTNEKIMCLKIFLEYIWRDLIEVLNLDLPEGLNDETVDRSEGLVHQSIELRLQEKTNKARVMWHVSLDLEKEWKHETQAFDFFFLDPLLLFCQLKCKYLCNTQREEKVRER